MAEPRIHILPPEVFEKIAAGEVVERPASAVKELVENALDAGATRVTVEVEGGGKELIRVSDDGGGMTPEEAGLAILRHATSKLRTADDLFDLHTLGFRGEALPSIAAVARLEIVTRTPDAETGTRVAVEGGEVAAVEPVAVPVGTTVTVRRLFFNTPARQKFLRSDLTEAAHITELMQRVALVHHRVTFRLVNDGRETLLSPGSEDPLNAVVAVWGRPLARELLRVAPWGDESLSVSGFAGKPSVTRANRHYQLVFVNGRPVRTPLFYRALDEAYRASMPSGRHPLAILFVRIDPAAVDVNVHPSKVEVRFRDEYAVYGAILGAVRETLSAGAYSEAATEAGDVVREVAPSGYGSPAPAPPAVPDPFEEEPGPRRPDRPPGTLPFADAAMGAFPRGQFPQRPWTHGQPPSRRDEPPPDDRPAALTAPPSPGREAAPAAPAQPAFAALRPLGQVRDLFVLAEAEGKLWVIDQHVAHERILFDRLTRPSAAAEPVEPLLIPLTLTLEPRERLALEAHLEALQELGFALEAFGPEQYVVRGVPHSLLERNYEQALRDMVDELAELSNGGRTRLRREELAMAAAGRACKSAIKAGQPLSQNEAERMLEELRHTRNPYTCPHGRPIFLIYSPEEVAALFGSRSCE